jgi:hypothetical protein
LQLAHALRGGGGFAKRFVIVGQPGADREQLLGPGMYDPAAMPTCVSET